MANAKRTKIVLAHFDALAGIEIEDTDNVCDFDLEVIVSTKTKYTTEKCEDYITSQGEEIVDIKECALIYLNTDGDIISHRNLKGADLICNGQCKRSTSSGGSEVRTTNKLSPVMKATARLIQKKLEAKITTQLPSAQQPSPAPPSSPPSSGREDDTLELIDIDAADEYMEAVKLARAKMEKSKLMISELSSKVRSSQDMSTSNIPPPILPWLNCENSPIRPWPLVRVPDTPPPSSRITPSPSVLAPMSVIIPETDTDNDVDTDDEEPDFLNDRRTMYGRRNDNVEIFTAGDEREPPMIATKYTGDLDNAEGMTEKGFGTGLEHLLAQHIPRSRLVEMHKNLRECITRLEEADAAEPTDHFIRDNTIADLLATEFVGNIKVDDIMVDDPIDDDVVPSTSGLTLGEKAHSLQTFRDHFEIEGNNLDDTMGDILGKIAEHKLTKKPWLQDIVTKVQQGTMGDFVRGIRSDPEARVKMDKALLQSAYKLSKTRNSLKAKMTKEVVDKLREQRLNKNPLPIPLLPFPKQQHADAIPRLPVPNLKYSAMETDDDEVGIELLPPPQAKTATKTSMAFWTDPRTANHPPILRQQELTNWEVKSIKKLNNLPVERRRRVKSLLRGQAAVLKASTANITGDGKAVLEQLKRNVTTYDVLHAYRNYNGADEDTEDEDHECIVNRDGTSLLYDLVDPVQNAFEDENLGRSLVFAQIPNKRTNRVSLCRRSRRLRKKEGPKKRGRKTGGTPYGT